MFSPLVIRAIVYGLALAAIVGALWTIHHHIYMQGYNKAVAENQVVLAKANEKYNDIAAQLEVAKSEKHIVYETITKQVDKIIDRPVYRNVCLDDDGLRDINAALAGKPAAKPDAAVSATIAP